MRKFFEVDHSEIETALIVKRHTLSIFHEVATLLFPLGTMNIRSTSIDLFEILLRARNTAGFIRCFAESSVLLDASIMDK